MQTLTVVVSEETAETLNAWARAERREPGELAGEKLDDVVAADARNQRAEILARLPDTRWEDGRFIYAPSNALPAWVETLLASAPTVRAAHQAIETEQSDADFLQQVRERL